MNMQKYHYPMKKNILFLIICVFAQFIVFQANTQNRIDTFKVDSKSFKETETVKVALPSGYDYSIKLYPIIVVLDNQ